MVQGGSSASETHHAPPDEPRNPTVIAVLIICMLSIAAALFQVLEIDRPFDGMIRLSSASLRAASPVRLRN
jgi:hypothetical protein